MKKVMVVFGTRPEAIKMVPVIKKIQQEKDFKLVICTTEQHKEMLNQVLEKFNIEPNYRLNIMKEEQTLTYITTEVINKMDEIIKKENPNIVLVHGDTTTSFATAVSAFYNKIKIGHVEAGLRTKNKYSPYPEEMNRVLISDLADVHFAPTETNKKNLINEGIDEKDIFVTGNTVIDTVHLTVRENYKFEEKELQNIHFNNSTKYILLTAHRRENLGKPLENICKAVDELTKKRQDIEIIFPVHYNPKVRETVFNLLSNNPKIHLIDPINVFDMHNLMNKMYLILTDSGGLQEEASELKKPVLVLRENTERLETVRKMPSGGVKVIGTNSLKIISETENLLDNKKEYEKMSNAINPFGDGHASERIVKALKNII